LTLLSSKLRSRSFSAIVSSIGIPFSFALTPFSPGHHMENRLLTFDNHPCDSWHDMSPPFFSLMGDFFISVDINLHHIYSVIMNKLAFQWDDNKNVSNRRKHGVSFEEAQTVFFDENAIEFDDPDHSIEEGRFILLGLSQRFKVLVVCHCYRSDESQIRIISARKATKREQGVYSGRSL
jgi:uncharacterized protein